MSFTLCTSMGAIVRAGANVNSDIAMSGGALNAWSDEVEGTLCMKTREDWVTRWPTISASNLAPSLTSYCTGEIAIRMINYDMAGYLKGEAQTMLDVLKDSNDTIIKDLRESEFKDEI